MAKNARSYVPHGIMSGCKGLPDYHFLLVLTTLLSLTHRSVSAIELVPPPPPKVLPVISEFHSSDKQGDKIDDGLQSQMQTTILTDKTITAASEPVQGEMIEVELIFNRQISQEQIDGFLLAGGDIRYIYKGLSYGWYGLIPLRSIEVLPLLMGPSLVLIEQPAQENSYLDLATASGRVRPVWQAGFAGSSTGYRGDPNITIGFIDSGIDGFHTDLVRPKFYWHDLSGESDEPIDYDGHGTAVAGVALGSGAAAGAGGSIRLGAKTIWWTDTGNLENVEGNRWIPNPFRVDARVVMPYQDAYRLWAQAFWSGGSTATLSLLEYEANQREWVSLIEHSGPSGLELDYREGPYASDGFVSQRVSLGLFNTGGQVRDYVISSNITGFLSKDEFNLLSGVAPACNWAAVKVEDRQGRTVEGGSGRATEHLAIERRIEDKIRVINTSRGAVSDDGLPMERESWRDKVNSAVRNGVVMVVAAGNDAEEGTEAARRMADPARARLAITVGASNDNNALTAGSTYGFSNPDSSEGYKPDLIAPGGSGYYSKIMTVDSGTSDGPFLDQKEDDYTNASGTSLSAPFVAGCVALVIQAMERNGTTWDFESEESSNFVKMVLCATATETNQLRENGVLEFSPTLQRARKGPDGFPVGKDRYEGYGIINPDAAIELVSESTHLLYQGDPVRVNLGGGSNGRRAWATFIYSPPVRYVLIGMGVVEPPEPPEEREIKLVNPSTGDFDLYMYDRYSTPTPTIVRSSTNEGKGGVEKVSWTVPVVCVRRGDAVLQKAPNVWILVVKRISGHGEFRLEHNVAP